jgi:hypothetical protein
MATFQRPDGTEVKTTPKNFVTSSYPDAECLTLWEGQGDDAHLTYVVKSIRLMEDQHQDGVLGAGKNPNDAWSDAAAKLEIRLHTGEEHAFSTHQGHQGLPDHHSQKRRSRSS